MKTYFFNESVDVNTSTVKEVKEEDLTDVQKDLLVETMLNQFEKLPDILKSRFVSKCSYLHKIVEQAYEFGSNKK